MPTWLIKQLSQAFLDKDRRQIKYLNECWFSAQEVNLTQQASPKKKHSPSINT